MIVLNKQTVVLFSYDDVIEHFKGMDFEKVGIMQIDRSKTYSTFDFIFSADFILFKDSRQDSNTFGKIKILQHPYI